MKTEEQWESALMTTDFMGKRHSGDNDRTGFNALLYITQITRINTSRNALKRKAGYKRKSTVVIPLKLGS